MNVSKLIILLLLISSKIYGQCGTDITVQYLRNPSFEAWQNDPYDYSGYNNFCPNCPNPNDQLCTEYQHSNIWLADYWRQGTDYGTSDYYNTSCPVTLNDMPAMPSSVRNNPDGSGFVGFIVSNEYLEYIATCPITPFVAGQTYTLTFSIASFNTRSGGDPCSRQSSPVSLALYGRTTCPTGQPGNWFEQPTFLINGDQGCFLGAPYVNPPYMQLIQSFSYLPSPNWSTISVTFTPTFNVGYLAIGGLCGVQPGYTAGTPPCYPYFVMDGMSVRNTVCNDNNACTTDNCVNGQCTYTTRSCNDNNLCTTDNCVPNIGCVYTPINCSDLNPCTIDRCTNGVCSYQPRTCTDNDLCTDDACVGGNCRYTPKVCNDNNGCTDDVCINGVCIFIPRDCDDANLCTNDVCVNGSCIYNTRVCNDNNPCTTNGCHPSLGCIYIPLNCNDNNPCTTDICLN